MSTFILIHGACHGGWCWYKVVALLENRGHTAIAPDLPSHGTNKTPVSTVSFQTYVDSVCKIIDAQPEPVVLVGHSMGGGIITQVAEYRPDKIKTLVYITGLLPTNGQSLSEALPPPTESVALANVVMAEDRSSITVREEALREAFYGDCSIEDVALAKLLLVPQATAPLATPVRTTTANFGRIPRVYIECRQDRTFTQFFQKKWYAAQPCQKVIAMDTSHSPFFSAPGELAAHLDALCV